MVEETLARFSEAKGGLEPGPRAYAGLLHAYSRLRRGDVASARERVRGLGYVNHWLLLGPFDNDGKAGFETAWGRVGWDSCYAAVESHCRWLVQRARDEQTVVK